MRQISIKILSSVVLLSLLAGCTSPSGRPDYTGSGALIGGASGAAIGAMADRRNPGAGALIGGAAGLIAGGLIGHSMDQDAEARRRAYASTYYAPPPVTPPSVGDVKAMVRSGLSDDVIIGQISSTHAVYNLDANALIDLKNAGVSEKVIAFMVNTSSQTVATAPPAPQVETVMASPGPDYVWMDGEYVWNGSVWVWVGGRWILPPYRHAVWVPSHWERGPWGWRRVPGHWR